ncbi:hypothetical protein [Halioxenophilus sp. WMMB6]|uniref:hypothetical protein n=1 Tax=Halioxenophilus sp. WMMB6 TaxID=3073815 RepID=UPI00295EE1C1|nr:hypothetical protein [Halioxenophilus sp. WMMB6]
MESILLTHSQLAAVLAGFASVVAAFQRPLSPVQRHRFLTILFSALVQMMASLVPVWFATIDDVGPLFWSIFSGVQLGFSLLLWLILVYPLRSLGKAGVVAINMPVTVFVHLLGVAVVGTLMVNTFFYSIASFSLYYSAMLGGLIIIFLVFADVATRAE